MVAYRARSGALRSWVVDCARATIERSWGLVIWKCVRWLPPLRKFAVTVRDDKEKAELEMVRANRIRDTQEISELFIEGNKGFLSTRSSVHAIEGMFDDFSIAVIDSLLSFQEGEGVTGNLLELGVYRGRSAALLGRHLRKKERLVLVDVDDFLDRQAIESFSESTDYLICSTENVAQRHPEYFEKPRAYRFIHIDAGHAYRATFAELKIADWLLADRGIIALDDFTNTDFSQNAAAIFKYLYTSSTDLVMFLVTEKAYLCRRQDASFYASFVLDRLIAEMRSREIYDCMLARTDVDPEYSAFSARRRRPHETGHFYALDIYKNYFRWPW